MKNWIEAIYWYCTDFCINAANVLGISYFEFNFWLFLVIMPAMLVVLVFLNLKRFLKVKNDVIS